MGGNIARKARIATANKGMSFDTHGLNSDKEYLSHKDVQVIEQAWLDLYRIAEVYKKSSAKLEKSRKEHFDYHKTKVASLDSQMTKNKKDEIETLMKDYDEELKKINELKEKANEDYQKAKILCADAQISESEMTKYFESGKNYLVELEKRLKGLEGIKEAIDKQDANKNPAYMHCLLWDFKDSLEATVPRKNQDFKKQLLQQWDALRTAKNELRKCEEKRDTSKNNSELIQKNLEALQQNRRVAIMKEMANVE